MQPRPQHGVRFLREGEITDTAAMVRELYWSLITRSPTGDETKVMEALLASAKDKRSALEEIAWSLINAKEFMLRP